MAATLNKGKLTVLVISDLQIPFQHPDALQFLKDVMETFGPDKVVCIGDEVDQHALSRYETDPQAEMAGPELARAIEALKPFYELFPKVLVCESNHTARVYKQAFRAGIPEEYIRPIKEWLQAPKGWDWARYWEVDGVRYEHGDAQGGMYAARNLAIRNRQSTVIGHHHSHGAVYYIANDDTVIFGMNVGCLIDESSLAFKYAKQAAFKPTLGCGLVIQGVPLFVPMLTNKKDRYIGEILA